MSTKPNEYGTLLMVVSIMFTKKGNGRKNRVKIKRDGLFSTSKQYGTTLVEKP